MKKFLHILTRIYLAIAVFHTFGITIALIENNDIDIIAAISLIVVATFTAFNMKSVRELSK